MMMIHFTGDQLTTAHFLRFFLSEALSSPPSFAAPICPSWGGTGDRPIFNHVFSGFQDSGSSRRFVNTFF